MIITFKNGTFVAISSFAEKDIPKNARFRWNPTDKRWETDDAQRASSLAQYADESALEALRSAGHVSEARYVALSGTAKKATLTTGKKLAIEETAARLENNSEETAAIHTLLKRLAGVCDGAAKLDGAGFNAMDTDFGHQLANSARLSPRQAAYGRKMLWKYRTQIDGDLFAFVFSAELRVAIDKETDNKLKKQAAREEKKLAKKCGVSADVPAVVNEVQHTPTLPAVTAEEEEWMDKVDEATRDWDKPESTNVRPSESSAVSATVHVIRETKRERAPMFLDFDEPEQSACPELWMALNRLRDALADDTEHKRRILDEAIGTAFEIVRAETKVGNAIQFTKKRVA